MSSSTQYTTFSDLYTGLQNSVRVTTGITATEDQAKRYINVALQDMHLGMVEKFPWAERNAILVTQPQYSTGTLTATLGSAALVGSGTAWNTASATGPMNVRVGGKFVIAGGFEVYEVLSVASDTSVTLSSVFTQTTTAGANYVYFEDEYALAADYLRPLDQRSFADNIVIELISRTEFRRRYPRSNITGRPEVATIVDKPFSGNTTPVRKVSFWRPPSSVFMIPYSYITSNLAVSATGTAQSQLSASTDEPIVPLRYRHALVLHALYNWYRDKKDDARSQEVKAEYTDIMLRLGSDFEIGAARPQIRPRISHYWRRARAPYLR